MIYWPFPFFLSIILAGVKIFHDFLKSQYSEENLLFWLAVEKLKKESDQAAVKELAQSIYRDYLSAESPKEASIKKYVVYEHLEIPPILPCARREIPNLIPTNQVTNRLVLTLTWQYFDMSGFTVAH